MREANLLKPRAARPGDRVAIIAPASPFPQDAFMAGVDEVRRLGFEPVVAPGVFDRRRYTAGEPASRARDLMAAWQDPGVAAILTARGGYGSAELLPLLSIPSLRQSPKLLVGFSDVTSLLSFLTTRCGVTALHGPTVAGGLGGGGERYDQESFLRALTSGDPAGELAAPALEVLAPGEAEGPVYGGNLTQLAASMGTPFAFDPPHGCVLFLEDVNERPYRIDRMLTQLKYAGIIDRARALVFGEMPGCDEPDRSITARDVVREACLGFAGPLLWALPAGHTTGPALTLPLGVRARIASDPRPSVVLLEAAVSDTPNPESRIPNPEREGTP
jgi:muramoyltetrapeptide carboxypeptidase